MKSKKIILHTEPNKVYVNTKTLQMFNGTIVIKKELQNDFIQMDAISAIQYIKDQKSKVDVVETTEVKSE